MRKCPNCDTRFGAGKRIDFTDLARVIVRIYTCPKCGCEITVDTANEQIIKVRGLW